MKKKRNTENKTIEIRPQKGKQELFLSSPADICIYGGAAGGGKTYALLLECLRHIDNRLFEAVIFRQSRPQILSAGGLYATSQKIYPYLGATSILTPDVQWRFPSGAKVTFGHMFYEKDRLEWQGSQITFIGFDELTHFSEGQFFYMLSRNRSVCGIKPYVRATTNPDSDSWVAEFIKWWINQDTGYPIPERSGVLRWMFRHDNQIYWGNSPEELVCELGEDMCDPHECKSVTFIASNLSDNKILTEKDPSYLSNLKALPEVEREQLLYGNWKIKPAAGLFFRRSQITIIDSTPDDVIRWVRGWDLAATSESEGGSPAYTAGVLMGKRRNGRYVVADVHNKRYSADEARQAIRVTAQMDKAKYRNVKIKLPQDPGQAGKAQAESFIKFLAGFNVTVGIESGSKEIRAEPFAAQWQHGNVDIVVGEWNEEYFSQLESFPESKFKDMVDASSSAFSELERVSVSSLPKTDGLLKNSSYWRG